MSANIHIRLSEEKKKELTKQAQKEGLSLNAFMLAAANDRIVTEIRIFHRKIRA